MKPEKRVAERYAYPARIEYLLEAGPSGELQNGVAINISQSGLALYAFSPLAEGQEIVITSALPVDHRRAKIRWVRHEHDCMYKTGVKFINGAIRADEKPRRA
ncbi:MAG: hypothetical protein A2010_03535 [Nitrospirae bacterium GWD2_57_9]|nr:MAG: hypothetical protein A2010_03535 [Nitrospirae bacterium GWD2_57_9]OGW48871.1 MAG: hypothetical protein A2078_09210 [Nitrospirae bacterium GWC2_57_9]